MRASSVQNFRNPPRAAWNDIAIRMHAGLAATRPHFMDKCLKAGRGLTETPAQTGKLDQASELAVLVCQLLFGRLLIALEEYFSSPDTGQQFVEAMFEEARRYGPDSQRDDLIRRYFKDDDEGIKRFVFGSDLAKYITGRDAPRYGTELADRPVEFLRLTSWFVVAHAFGDSATTVRVKKELDSF